MTFVSRMSSPPRRNHRDATLRREARAAAHYWISVVNDQYGRDTPFAGLANINHGPLGFPDSFGFATGIDIDNMQSRKPPVTPPAVRFDLCGTSAAAVEHDTGAPAQSKALLRINASFLYHYAQDTIDLAIPHQIAHVAARWIWGERIRPHNREWVAVMRLFNMNPLPCGAKCTEPDPKVRHFAHLCACVGKTHKVSAYRHRRILRKQAVYHCHRCDDPLRPKYPNQPIRGHKRTLIMR